MKKTLGWAAGWILLTCFSLGTLWTELKVSHHDYLSTTLEQMKKSPQDFENIDVRFSLRFHRLEKTWIPFYTPFTSDLYLAFSGWGKEQEIWKQNEMMTDFPFLFVPKQNKTTLQKILALKEFQEVEIFGRVRSTFNHIPWIEVADVSTPGLTNLTPALISRLIEAFSSIDQGKNKEAIATLEKIKKESLPPDAQFFVYEALGRLYYLDKDLHASLENFSQAYALREDGTVRQYMDLIQQELHPSNPASLHPSSTPSRIEKRRESSLRTGQDQQHAWIIQEFQRKLRDQEEELLSLRQALEQRNTLIETLQTKEAHQNGVIRYLSAQLQRYSLDFTHQQGALLQAQADNARQEEKISNLQAQLAQAGEERHQLQARLDALKTLLPKKNHAVPSSHPAYNLSPPSLASQTLSHSMEIGRRMGDRRISLEELQYLLQQAQ